MVAYRLTSAGVIDCRKAMPIPSDHCAVEQWAKICARAYRSGIERRSLLRTVHLAREPISTRICREVLDNRFSRDDQRGIWKEERKKEEQEVAFA